MHRICAEQIIGGTEMNLRNAAIGLSLLFVASPAIACDWGRVEADMKWCLVDGANVRGRGTMKNALQQSDSNFIGGVQNGFHECQVSGGIKGNFDNCKHEDQGRLFNVGRRILGLPPT
jgi:hypothetical protein